VHFPAAGRYLDNWAVVLVSGIYGANGAAI